MATAAGEQRAARGAIRDSRRRVRTFVLGVPEMKAERWRERWRALESACELHGATDRWAEGRTKPMRCIVAPPAEDRAIARIEKRLGASLPASLRRVIAKHSSSVDIGWQLPEGERASLPPEFRGIFAGEIRWDLAELPDLAAEHAKWVSKCFADPADSYNAVWHDKLPILRVGTGDMIGIETGREHAGRVVFLSHDDGEGHGYILGTSFEDYIDRLSRIGGVGAEDWQWVRFTSSRTSGIEPDSALAERWRRWFGLTWT